MKAILLSILLLLGMVACSNLSPSQTIVLRSNNGLDICIVGDTLTIKRENVNLSLVKRNGEYIDGKNGQVFLSTLHTVDSQLPIGKNLKKKIYMGEVGDVERQPKPIHAQKLFVRREYLEDMFSKDGELIILEVYFDQNYNILQVTTFGDTGYVPMPSKGKQPYTLSASEEITYEFKKVNDTLLWKEITTLCHSRNASSERHCKAVYSQGNYIDADTHEILFSNHASIDKTTSTRRGIPFGTRTRIYKMPKGWLGYDKDIFCSEFSTTKGILWGEKQLLIAYYYDKEYNMVKIVKPTLRKYEYREE